ncbi:MAG: tetratricopeptide repeat protein [Cyanobacteriota bacterium]
MESQSSDNLKSIFNKALTNLQSGQLDQAKEGFVEIISINPKSAEAYLNLGNAFFLEEDITNAIKNFEKAIEIDPTLAKAYLNIGNCFFKREEYLDAVGYWSIGVNINPNNAQMQRNIAVAYEKIDNMQKAFNHYEAFLKCNTSNDLMAKRILRKVQESKRVAYHNLNVGVAQQQRNKWAEAALAYQKSIKTYPNFSKAHMNLGGIYYRSEKYEEAIKCWEAAIKLEPGHGNSHCNLAIAYDKIKKPDEALYHYKKYLEITAGRTNDAPQIKQRIDSIQDYLADRKELVRQHVNKANELFRRKLFEEAIDEFNKYIALYPTAPDLQIVKNKIIEAETRLNPVQKAKEIALQMGDDYFRQNLYDKAIAAYNRYLNLSPSGPEANEIKLKIDQCHKNISNVVSAMLKSD